jgi:hypothetical protein
MIELCMHPFTLDCVQSLPVLKLRTLQLDGALATDTLAPLLAWIGRQSNIVSFRTRHLPLPNFAFLQPWSASLEELTLTHTHVPLTIDAMRALLGCHALRVLQLQGAGLEPAPTALQMTPFGKRAWFPHLHTLSY